MNLNFAVIWRPHEHRGMNKCYYNCIIYENRKSCSQRVDCRHFRQSHSQWNSMFFLISFFVRLTASAHNAKSQLPEILSTYDLNWDRVFIFQIPCISVTCHLVSNWRPSKNLTFKNLIYKPNLFIKKKSSRTYQNCWLAWSAILSTDL